MSPVTAYRATCSCGYRGPWTLSEVEAANDVDDHRVETGHAVRAA